MENIIFCFSGTGNSLSAARDIAKMLGNTELVLIADAIENEHTDLSFERIGFVFPAYFRSLPPIVERFVKKLNFSKTQYVFAVITAGVAHGGALNSFSRLIAQRGGRLNAGFPIRMPGNYIAMYGAFPSQIQRIMLMRARKRTEQIAEAVSDKREIRSCEKDAKLPKTSLTEKMSGYERFAKGYHVTDKCIGCQTCVKICPTHNIALVDGKPHFGDSCERCMACIQWCPVEAIEYEGKTERRKRYRNPDVHAQDLFPKA